MVDRVWGPENSCQKESKTLLAKAGKREKKYGATAACRSQRKGSEIIAVFTLQAASLEGKGTSTGMADEWGSHRMCVKSGLEKEKGAW